MASITTTDGIPPAVTPGRRNMAKLTTAGRKALPASDFAGPDRSYPVPDKSHAANAKARVADKSPALRAKVDAKADRVLGKGRGLENKSSPSQVLRAKKGMTKVPKGPLSSKTLGSMVDSLKRR
jgi:hypothetical protein